MRSYKEVERLVPAALVVWLCAGALACDPDIGTGAYYCGPEMLCPPDLSCDPNSFSCVVPSSVTEFACAVGTERAEPDDDVLSVAPAIDVACDFIPNLYEGCLAEGDEVDHFGFTIHGDCFGEDPHLEVALQFPIAFVELDLDLVDAAGEVIASSEECTPSTNFTGRHWLCVSQSLQTGTYYLRVRPIASSAAGDCDGACRFSPYQLHLRYPPN